MKLFLVELSWSLLNFECWRRLEVRMKRYQRAEVDSTAFCFAGCESFKHTHYEVKYNCCRVLKLSQK